MVKQGDFIKSLRKGAGLTQSDFGNLIGKVQEEVSAIENGKQLLKIQEWILIARTFRSEVAELIAEGLMYRAVVDFSKIKNGIGDEMPQRQYFEIFS